MEETNVTMTAEEMQGEPAAKENETRLVILQVGIIGREGLQAQILS